VIVLTAALLTVAMAFAPSPDSQERTSTTYVTIPADKQDDLKLYRAGGQIVTGAEALGRMQQEARLILWLAGNQFFAMDQVVRAYQRRASGVDVVGLITLPPGLILTAIQKGGWTYRGVDYPGVPDIYSSVNLEHFKPLKRAGLMDTYAIYMHNELVLMVARGNPKNIMSIADLGRPDVRTSMPNPLNEGIMQFYGRKVLERHGLWQHISGGKECFSCQTSPSNWFTSVHHRETPERIRDGRSDVGLVWKTEALEAQRTGQEVETVLLPPADSLRAEVSYAIGALATSPRKAAAMRYLSFLATPEGQEAYTRFGFFPATAEELTLKPIP
jgi:ABC-type molybdate transport system substrate-binding protein